MDNIPPIYIINLKRTPERRLSISRQLDKYNLRYQFVEAIDKYDLGSSRYRARIARSLAMAESDMEWKYKKCGLGGLACTLSHLKVYNLILKSDATAACILEDDAILLPRFVALLKEAFRYPWDVLTLSSHSATISDLLRNYIRMHGVLMVGNYVVPLYKTIASTQYVAKNITKRMCFPEAALADQSKVMVKRLKELRSESKKKVKLCFPNKHFVRRHCGHIKWRIWQSALITYIATQVGGLPASGSQQKINDDCYIAKPAEDHAAAMGLLIKRSAVKEYRKVVIGRNITEADQLPWHFLTQNKMNIRFVYPPCVTSFYLYNYHNKEGEGKYYV